MSLKCKLDFKKKKKATHAKCDEEGEGIQLKMLTGSVQVVRYTIVTMLWLQKKKEKSLKMTARTLFCSYGTDSMRYEATLLSIYIQLADIYSLCTCVLP